MHFETETPGMKLRRNRDGTTRLLWVARATLVKAGYLPKSVRLHYNADDPAHAPLISAACHKLQAEMLEWSSGRRENRAFDGTVASLVHLYQTEESSPYRELKWNTRRTYDQVLATIEKAFGKRSLTALKLDDFRRWYNEAKKPKAQVENRGCARRTAS
jgi:hypothetical protein